MINPLIKPVKKALAKKYGYKNVSVKNGTGTSWGWVCINVYLDRPIGCACTNEEECGFCKTLRGNNTWLNVERAAIQALEDSGLKLRGFTDDMGSDGRCILVQVRIK